MGKEKKISHILFWSGIIAVIIGISFIIYALNHPEMSFPGGVGIAYFIYTTYILGTILLFVLANIFRKWVRKH